MKTEIQESDDLSVMSSPSPASDLEEVEMAKRLERVPRDVGWMLLGAGFAGFVAPGVLGLPFMVAGGMILWPKTTARLNRALSGNSPANNQSPGTRQIIRFLDDLERRYPSNEHP